MKNIHKIKWIALGAIFVFFSIFVIQNTGLTSVRFLGWETEAPRMIVIAGVGLVCFVGGVLTILLIQRHRPQEKPTKRDSSKSDSIAEK